MLAHKGACFCGTVEIVATGIPESMGYCHCASCRSWAAAPVNAFTLWKPGNVRIVKGLVFIADFMKTPNSDRKFCMRCGGHLMTYHPSFGVIDVFASKMPSLAFKPTIHVNYAEAILPMKDGLPKLRDFPREFGGSGELVAE